MFVLRRANKLSLTVNYNFGGFSFCEKGLNDERMKVQVKNEGLIQIFFCFNSPVFLLPLDQWLFHSTTKKRMWEIRKKWCSIYFLPTCSSESIKSWANNIATVACLPGLSKKLRFCWGAGNGKQIHDTHKISWPLSKTISLSEPDGKIKVKQLRSSSSKMGNWVNCFALSTW